MSLIASAEGGSTSTPAPAGTHIAYAVQVIDFGTQDDEYMGKPRVSHKARITFELPTQKAIFVDERGEEPYHVGKEYTVSLHEKANLRHDLENWRGRPFTEKELEGFDLRNILGKPCLVTIQHGKSQAGKAYAKITAITSIPAAMKSGLPPMVAQSTLFYDIEQGRDAVFKSLPEWLQNKIADSREFRMEGNPNMRAGGDPSLDAGGDPSLDPEEDDIPF